MRLEFGGAISIEKRLLLMLVSMISLYAILFYGSMAILTQAETQQILGMIEELLRDISVWKIFLNNFQISLFMLVPFIGTVGGGYIIYSTGTVFAAYSQYYGIPSIYLVGSAILSPYGILEFISYGLATSEGIILVYSIVKKRFRRELLMLPVVIAAMAGMLLVAAAVEMMLLGILA